MIFWLLIYWLGAAIGSVILLFTSMYLIIAGPNSSATLFITTSLATGAAALVTGAIMATVLTSWGISSVAFIRATSAIRTNAVAWVGSTGLAVTILMMFPGEFPTTGTFVDSALEGAPEALTAILGFGAALLLVGAGLVEFSEGKARTVKKGPPLATTLSIGSTEPGQS